MGAAEHPAFPVPSCFRGDDVDASLGQIMPRECEGVFSRHCERSEAIHGAASGAMDCFVASLLAMTTQWLFENRIRVGEL